MFILETDKKFKVFNDGKREYHIKNGEVVPDGLVAGKLPWSDEHRERFIKTWEMKSDEEKSEINIKRSVAVKKADAEKDPEQKALEYEKRKDTMRNKSDEEKAIYRKKISDSTMGKNKGKVAWSKGKTKNDCPSIKSASEKNSAHMKEYWENKTKEEALEWRASARKKMHENGTCKTSRAEDMLFEELCAEYGSENVIRHYDCDPRYPFECDFYIKTLDLFIELNKHPSHGTHPFNPNSIDDILLFEELSGKEDKWSKMILDVWANRDVIKLETAIKNNLNYKVIY